MLVLLIGGLIQTHLVIDPDLAWLWTLDEKWLAGQRLYVDLFEVNPPISPVLYLPALLVSRATGAPFASVVVAQMLALVCACVAVTWRLTRGLFENEDFSLRFALSLLFLFILFPVDVFGQRDYVAVVALTPFVALAAARRGNLETGRTWVILAGLGAGVAMAIKPHYALPAGLPLLFNAVSRRSLRPLFGLETWVAAAVVIVYGAWAVTAFPAYFGSYLSALVIAYLPPGQTFSLSTLIRLLYFAIPMASLFCLRMVDDDRIKLFAPPWIAASLGGVAIYFMIGKWWSYTAFAMLAFTVPPVLFCLTKSGEARPVLLRWGARLVAVAAAGAGMMFLFVGPQFPYLRVPVASIAPPHPKMISITDDVAVGHPLVHELQGDWVGTSAAQVLSGGAIRLQRIGGLTAAKREVLARIEQADRLRLASDIERTPPDIILSDSQRFGQAHFDWWAWANRDPRLARDLANYRLVGVVYHRIEVWKRLGAAGPWRMTLDSHDADSSDP